MPKLPTRISSLFLLDGYILPQKPFIFMSMSNNPEVSLAFCGHTYCRVKTLSEKNSIVPNVRAALSLNFKIPHIKHIIT